MEGFIVLKPLGDRVVLKVEKEKEEISISIAKENIKSPILTKDQYKLALSNYRKVDITKLDGKRKLIDTFINSIFVYDDNIKIVYNGYNKEEIISLDEIESSNLISSGAPSESNPNRWVALFLSHNTVTKHFLKVWTMVICTCHRPVDICIHNLNVFSFCIFFANSKLSVNTLL